MSKSVLALGCDDRSGLTVVRSLGRAGIKVDIDSFSDQRAATSRYVRNIVDVPDPGDLAEKWLETLQALNARYKYKLIIPCSDNAVIPIQQHKFEIAKFSNVYTLSERAFIGAFDKYQTTLIADRCGIRLPKWTLVRSPDDVETVSNDFASPLVLKPISSFNLDQALTRREVKVIRDRADLIPTLTSMLADSPVLAQAFFPGRGVGVELLAKNGVRLVAFQHERVHEPPTGGGSSYRRSVPLDPELLHAAEAIVAELKYTGLAMIEFRVNPETKDWILVEVNGRVWGSLPLAVAAGIDFPRYLYEMLIEGRVDFPQSYKTHLYCRNIALDLKWLKKNVTADKRDPTLRVVPLIDVFFELKNILTFSERIDTFAVDDPRPFLVECRQIASRGLFYVREKAARLVGFLGLLKRWRASVAIRKLSAAPRIIFVCYGNICRSPFAEAYARTLAPPHIKFSSCGILQKCGRCAPHEAVVAAAKFGVDLTNHRSRVMSMDEIEATDVLVTFDRSNFQELSLKFPRTRGQVVRLGDFLLNSGDEVTDPFGRPLECFEECYGKIASSLSEISRLCWAIA